MDQLMPNTYLETIGGVLVGLSCLFGFTSVVPPLRSHAMRLLGMFLVVALALFSNNAWTYFAGIFIVATAVTELDFLQTLAAIVRGNTKYFDYQMKKLSKEQKEEKVREEQEMISGSSGAVITDGDEVDEGGRRGVSVDFTPLVQRLMKLEASALDEMEKYFGEKIERGVRISRKNTDIQVDGLISSDVDDMVPDKLIEVKYIGKLRNAARMRLMLRSAEGIVRKYRRITGRIAKLHLVFIVEGDRELTDSHWSELKQASDTSSVAAGFTVFTTEHLEKTDGRD